jgi:hypothetical protein
LEGEREGRAEKLRGEEAGGVEMMAWSGSCYSEEGEREGKGLDRVLRG